jgi:hypothetical protein
MELTATVPRSATAALSVLLAVTAIALHVAPAEAAAPAAQSPEKKTLAFVVTHWNTAIYESRFMDECPEGLNATNDEYWWRSLSKEDRGRLTDNGMTTQIGRQAIANHRGPHGEDICQQPDLVKDPPLKTAEGPLAYGMNLDGTTDGRETPASCAHEKFTGVDGAPAVDNQLYRLLGCVYGWRSIGHIETAANGHRQTNGLGMILIEIRGVEDPRNSDHVEVAFYRSIDQFTFSAADEVLPFSTYRTDAFEGRERYGDVLQGRIVDGILTTDPGDVSLPFYANYAFQTMHLKDMRLRLNITADGARAEGLIGAYYGLDQLWEYIGELGWQPTGVYNCASIFAAMGRLADGHRDSKTGRCTAISSAFRIKTVAAYIAHPSLGAPASSATATAAVRP